MTIIVGLYISCFIVCAVIDIKKTKFGLLILILLCTILTFLAGLRSMSWSDTAAYAYDFEVKTSNIIDYKYDGNLCYQEEGFYVLSSIIKTFSSDTSIYFLLISALTFYFLYIVLKTYSIYPLIGMFIYIARFILSRNFMQIRAALAIVIFLMTLDVIREHNIKKFGLISTAAFTLHHSTLFSMPLYFINKLNINKIHIFITISTAFLVIVFSPSTIASISIIASQYLNLAEGYVGGNNIYGEMKGLGDVMMYYQMTILFVFTLLENRLSTVYKNYYVVRNGYFFSTLILIIFNPIGIFSGRGSTMLATLEIIIIPLLIFSVPSKKIRTIITLSVIIAYSAIFYMNCQKYMF